MNKFHCAITSVYSENRPQKSVLTREVVSLGRSKSILTSAIGTQPSSLYREVVRFFKFVCVSELLYGLIFLYQ